jgi:hypothetical protein
VHGEEASSWSRRYLQERGAEDIPEVYDAIVQSAIKGDVRAQKLFVESVVGRPEEAVDHQMPELFVRLLETAAHSYRSTEVYEVGPQELPKGDTPEDTLP